VNGQQVWVQCSSWCIEDHVAANERHLEDVMHGSRSADLIVQQQDGPARLVLVTRLISSDSGSTEEREPLVTVDFEDVQGMYLPAAEADVFADSLVAFAEQVRAMARVARAA
jgi:hypothetical protein